MKEAPAIRLYRPLYVEYVTVGYILRYEKNFYSMTEDKFVKNCMVFANGSMNPNRAKQIYFELMEDAGLVTEHK